MAATDRAAISNRKPVESLAIANQSSVPVPLEFTVITVDRFKGAVQLIDRFYIALLDRI